MPTPIPSSLSEFDTELPITYSNTSSLTASTVDYGSGETFYQLFSDPIWMFGNVRTDISTGGPAPEYAGMCNVYVRRIIAGTFAGPGLSNFGVTGTVLAFTTNSSDAEQGMITFEIVSGDPVPIVQFFPVLEFGGSVWSGSFVYNTADNGLYFKDTPTHIEGDFYRWDGNWHGVTAPAGLIVTNIPGPSVDSVIATNMNDGAYFAGAPSSSVQTIGMTAAANCYMNHHRTVTISNFQTVENWNCEFIRADITIGIGSDSVTVSYNSGGSVSCADPDLGGPGLTVSASVPTMSETSSVASNIYHATTNIWTPVSVAATNTTYTISNNADIPYSGTTPYVRPGGTLGYPTDEYLPINVNSYPLFTANTLTQFEGNEYSLNVGSITITETDPPDLSSYALSVTAGSGDTGGKAAGTTANLVGAAGWRYLQLSVTASTSASSPPHLYLGVLPHDSEETSDYAAGATNLLNKIVANDTILSGWAWEIDYDWTTGGSQTITIDLAHGLYNVGRAGEFLSTYETTGVGFNFIQQNAAANYATLLTSCGLVLAVDSPNTTSSISDLELIMQADSSEIRFNLPSGGETYQFWYEQNCEVWGDLAGISSFQYTIEGDDVGTLNYQIPIVLSRDHKPSLSWGDYYAIPLSGNAFRNLYVPQFIASMNAMGNGYTFSLTSDYDLTNVPLICLLPMIHDIGQGAQPFGGGSYTFNLAITQASIVDNIPWWDDSNKHHYIDSYWWYRYARGLAFNDYTGNAYSGEITLQNATPHDIYSGDVTLLVGATPISGDFAWSATGSCTSDGWFEINCPVHYIPLNPLYNATILATFDDDKSCAYMATKYQEEIALRELVLQEADALYSDARNVIMVASTNLRGYLSVLYRNNFTTSTPYFPQYYTKTLSVKGLSPVITLADHSSEQSIFFKALDGSAGIVQSADLWKTTGEYKMIYPTVLGEICAYYDAPTNSTYYVQTIDATGVAISPATFEVCLQLRHYDGAGNAIMFNSISGAEYYDAGVWTNTLVTNCTNAGRPSIMIVSPHRLILAFGDQYWYSDDQGSTFYSQSGGDPIATTTNMGSSIYGPGSP